MGETKTNNFGILMYHRIAPRVEGIAPPTWNVPPERFRRQLTGLLLRGYQAWSLRKVLEYRAANRPIPPRTFVITFDDGYENIYYHAWPILKELQVPATIFLATAYLDLRTPFPFDDWFAAGWATVPLASWQPLSTAHCREMLDHGLVELGSHTHSHADFLDRPKSFRNDLARSMIRLEKRFGCREVPFAFPFGRHDAEMIDISRDSGAACALTTEPMPVAPGVDPFRWGRFTVSPRDNGVTLMLKLNGWYTAARSAWRWLAHWRKPRAVILEAAECVERSQCSRIEKARGVGPSR